MSKLKFRINEYEKYNTKKVSVSYASFKLDDECEIVEVNNTNYDYKKAVVKLSSDLIDTLGCYQDEVNEYLEKNDIPKITVLYGNRAYCKVKKNIPQKFLKVVKLKGVFVNDENKAYPQLWLEEHLKF